jgi:peptidoglycan/LPS O-acetylase OafA/YrhL
MQGTIRFYLAMCVVHAHILHYGAINGFPNPIAWMAISSAHAVMCFFIIAGFFAFYQLDRYFSTDRTIDVRSYYRDRLLRIYPTYLALIFLCALIYFLVAPWPVSVDASKFGDLARLVAYNLLPPAFNLGLMWSEFDAFRFAILPPSWSTGNEMVFYLLAPALLVLWRTNKMVLPIAMLGILVLDKAWHPTSDLVRYVNPLANIKFFILGATCYFLYNAASPCVRPSLWYVPVLLVVLVVAGHYASPQLVDKYDWFTYLFCASFAIFLTATFALVPKSRVDALIGNIAYPLFLVHVPVIELLKIGELTPRNLYAASFALSIGAAIVVYLAVECRSEAYRRSSRHAGSFDDVGDLALAASHLSK